MNLYRITLKLQSALGTPLKGDTLFGHFCWQVVHNPDLLNLKHGLQDLVQDYETRPGVVFSSAFIELRQNNHVRYALKAPDLPLSLRFPNSAEGPQGYWRERKEQEKRKWLLIQEDLRLDLARGEYLPDEVLLEHFKRSAGPEIRRLLRQMEIRQLCQSQPQPHNTINRLTGSTGQTPFAPYTQTLLHCCPGVRLALLVGIEKTVTDIGRVKHALDCIGQWGYGKDASIGQGRFCVTDFQKLSWSSNAGHKACYTLGPTVPGKNFSSEAYFTPFIRFGKHGDAEARGRTPFKSPVIMADEAAVFVPRDREVFQRPYLGAAVTGKSLSAAHEKTIMQGYSLYLPCTLPEEEPCHGR